MPTGTLSVAWAFSPALFTFRFQFGSPSSEEAHDVKHIHTLGVGFVENAENRSVTPDVPAAGAVAGGVKLLGNLAFAPIL